MLFLNSHIKTKDVTDGTTHTIYVGEKLAGPNDLGWMSGTRATLRNTGTDLNLTPNDEGNDLDDAEDALEWGTIANTTLYVGGFGSSHPGIVTFLFGDGAVRLLSTDISPTVFQQLGHRADGQLLTDGPTRGDGY